MKQGLYIKDSDVIKRGNAKLIYPEDEINRKKWVRSILNCVLNGESTKGHKACGREEGY